MTSRFHASVGMWMSGFFGALALITAVLMLVHYSLGRLMAALLLSAMSGLLAYLSNEIQKQSKEGRKE